MSLKQSNVKLLRSTEKALELIYITAKTCYSATPPTQIKIPSNEKEIALYVNKVMKSGHLAVIECATYTFAIEKVSRSLLAQITRHRLASFAVQSQRFCSMDNLDASDFIYPSHTSSDDRNPYEDFMHEYARSLEKYGELQNVGYKNEDARFVLPNGAPTNIVMTMNARELIHFFNLRCCSRAQWEIREVANEMLKIVIEKDPYIFKDFAGPSCKTLGYCPESKSCGRSPTLDILKDAYKQMEGCVGYNG